MLNPLRTIVAVLAGVVVLADTAGQASAQSANRAPSVDIELVIAVDVSYSKCAAGWNRGATKQFPWQRGNAGSPSDG